MATPSRVHGDPITGTCSPLVATGVETSSQIGQGGTTSQPNRQVNTMTTSQAINRLARLEHQLDTLQSHLDAILEMPQVAGALREARKNANAPTD